mgnify:CR=1 FL=1
MAVPCNPGDYGFDRFSDKHLVASDAFGDPTAGGTQEQAARVKSCYRYYHVTWPSVVNTVIFAEPGHWVNINTCSYNINQNCCRNEQVRKVWKCTIDKKRYNPKMHPIGYCMAIVHCCDCSMSQAPTANHLVAPYTAEMSDDDKGHLFYDDIKGTASSWITYVWHWTVGHTGDPLIC